MDITYTEDFVHLKPMRISNMTNLIREDMPSVIIVNIQGTIENSLNSIIKFQDCKDEYSRRFDETYLFADCESCLSFLNCETNHSLFCVLFNQSLQGDDHRHYPTVINFINEDGSLSFHIETVFNLEEDERLTEHFTYHEELDISITANEEAIDRLSRLIMQKTVPSGRELRFENLKIHKNVMKYNSYAYQVSGKNFYRVPVNSFDFTHDIRNKAVMLYMCGESSDANDMPKYAHNEYICFRSFDVMKGFLEDEGHVNYFYLFSEGMIEDIEITEETETTISVLLENDNDAYYDKYEIVFTVANDHMKKKIKKFIKNSIE